MRHSVQVDHSIWIEAPRTTVQAQFADIHHHIDANVHPKLRFELLAQEPRRARFRQSVRLLGMWQTDVIDRSIDEDGTIHDKAVEGFNKGATLDFTFRPHAEGGRPGTLVDIRIALPTPPFLGFLAPVIRKQAQRETEEAALQDKKDIEEGRYAPLA